MFFFFFSLFFLFGNTKTFEERSTEIKLAYSGEQGYGVWDHGFSEYRLDLESKQEEREKEKKMSRIGSEIVQVSRRSSLSLSFEGISYRFRGIVGR